MEDLYSRLAAPMPAEAVQHADTKAIKGYDSDGYGYQFVANRLNEVLGIGRWRTSHDVVGVDEGQTTSGKTLYAVTICMRIQFGTWDSGQWLPDAEFECYGGHESKRRDDAFKGAYTNAFKKTAALAGIGRAAYEGTMDDDHGDHDGKRQARQVAPKAAPVNGAPSQRSQAQPTQNHSAPARNLTVVPAAGGPVASEKSAKMLYAKATREMGLSEAEFKAWLNLKFGTHASTELSQARVSWAIDWLQNHDADTVRLELDDARTEQNGVPA